MPYTLAHPAFAVPLRRFGLPVSALAAGAAVPDTPLWATTLGRPIGEGYAVTHSLPGILTIDLVLGLGIWTVWHVLVREALYDSLPEPLRERAPLPASTRLTGRRVAAAALAVLVGAGSHVLLDEFTHVGRWGHEHIPWLSQSYAGLAGAQWAQYVAGVGGLVALAVMVALALHRAPARPRPVRSRTGRWAVTIGVLVGGFVAVADAAMVAATSLSAALFVLATRGVLAVIAGLLVGAIVWRATQTSTEQAERSRVLT